MGLSYSEEMDTGRELVYGHASLKVPHLPSSRKLKGSDLVRTQMGGSGLICLRAAFCVVFAETGVWTLAVSAGLSCRRCLSVPGD